MSEKSSSVVTGEQNPPRMRFPNQSVNGIGIMFYGAKSLSATTFEVTRWITLLGIPLVPLSTWEIEPTGIEYGPEIKHSFNIVANRSLNIKHVLLAYLFVALAVVPPAVMWLCTTWWSNFYVMMGIVIWMGLFVGVAMLRYQNMYKKAKRDI